MSQTRANDVPTDCLNCGSVLAGPHCHQCGQRVRGPVRRFREVLGEFLRAVFDLDSRTLRTLKPLFFQPGRLSREYFDGRRASYVTPLRLYLFSSVLAFFAIHASIETDEGPATAVSVGTPASPSTADAPASDDQGRRGIQLPVNGQPWHPTDNPVVVAWAPAAANDWLNRKMARADTVLEREDAEHALVEALFGALPQTLLLLLPVFALLLKLVYLFQRRLYMEHLVVALHSHAFIGLALSVLVGFVALEDWISRRSDVVAAGVSWLIAACGGWIPVYLLLTQKRVYGQRWPMTLLKYVLVGSVYLVMLSLGLGVALVFGLLSL